MQAVLVRLTGPERGQAEVFEEDLVRLGTHQTNDVVVDAQRWPTVVPFHAEIRQKDGTFLLVDVSFAGLWVNGRQASEAFLADGERSSLGSVDHSSGSGCGRSTMVGGRFPRYSPTRGPSPGPVARPPSSLPPTSYGT